MGLRTSKFWRAFHPLFKKKPIVNRDKSRSFRPALEALEDRFVPAGVAPLNLGTLSGHVFLDANHNSKFDSGEKLFAGVDIQLTGKTDGNQTVSFATKTDANGGYTFFQLEPGVYKLSRGNQSDLLGGKLQYGTLGGTVNGQVFADIDVEQGQTGLNYDFAVRGLGPTGVNLGDFSSSSTGTPGPNLTTGKGNVFSDGAGQPGFQGNSQTIASASANLASLKGFVFSDTVTVNGVPDSGEGLAGVQVVLTGVDSNGKVILTTTTKTGADGSYVFDKLYQGNYTINIVSQPAGFRAGLASPGSLGGVALRNNQITGIPVNFTDAGTAYNFAEIASAALPGSGLGLRGDLADDTGVSATDGLTSDDTVQGDVRNAVSLRGGFGATATFDLLKYVDKNGHFLLNPVVVTKIAGGTLADGAHTLKLVATDAQGNSTTVNVDFTLDATLPAQVSNLDFAAASKNADISVARVTSLDKGPNFTVTGTATPGITVQLIQGTTIQTTTADGTTGAFQFTLPLTAGSHALTFVTIDQAGNRNFITTDGLGSDPSAFIIDQTVPVSAIPTQNLTQGGRPGSPINLLSNFTAGTINPDSSTVKLDSTLGIVGEASVTVLRFHTVAGTIDVQLFDTLAPQTVANIIKYINAGKFNNTFFDRLIKNFVLQGGGFNYDSATHKITAIASLGTVPNEFSQAKIEVPGTIAMAKKDGQPNSATSAFFFNLKDNSANLDAQNSGFTVFGKIASGNDMRTLNKLAAFKTRSVTDSTQTPHVPFTDLPMKNYTGTNFPKDTTASNFALVSSVEILQQKVARTLTFTAVSDATNVVTTSVNGSQLTLTPPTGGDAGTATVTVTATDQFGLQTQTQFHVIVSAAP